VGHRDLFASRRRAGADRHAGTPRVAAGAGGEPRAEVASQMAGVVTVAGAGSSAPLTLGGPRTAADSRVGSGRATGQSEGGRCPRATGFSARVGEDLAAVSLPTASSSVAAAHQATVISVLARRQGAKLLRVGSFQLLECRADELLKVPLGGVTDRGFEGDPEDGDRDLGGKAGRRLSDPPPAQGAGALEMGAHCFEGSAECGYASIRRSGAAPGIAPGLTCDTINPWRV